MSNEQIVDSFKDSLEDRIKNDPRDVFALINLGVLEFEYYHESEKAVEHLIQAEKYDPSNVIVKFWLAKCLSYDFFEYEKAKEKLKEALRINPNSPECWSQMESILSENHESLTEALECVQKAIRLAPDWPMLRSKCAWLYYLLNKCDLAKAEIQIAMQIPALESGKITNEVERYYENVVTGRAWTNKRAEFEHLLALIEMKQKESK
jgi:tetratricopeptide (TPR) repeat protein